MNFASERWLKFVFDFKTCNCCRSIDKQNQYTLQELRKLATKRVAMVMLGTETNVPASRRSVRLKTSLQKQSDQPYTDLDKDSTEPIPKISRKKNQKEIKIETAGEAGNRLQPENSSSSNKKAIEEVKQETEVILN